MNQFSEVSPIFSKNLRFKLRLSIDWFAYINSLKPIKKKNRQFEAD